MWNIELNGAALQRLEGNATEPSERRRLEKLFVRFWVQFLYDPAALGVSDDASNGCGQSAMKFRLFERGPVFRRFDSIYCRDSWPTPNATAVRVWQRYVAENAGAGGDAELQPFLSDLMELLTMTYKGDYAYKSIMGNANAYPRPAPIGHMTDEEYTGTIPQTGAGSWSSLVPKAYLLQKTAD